MYACGEGGPKHRVVSFEMRYTVSGPSSLVFASADNRWVGMRQAHIPWDPAAAKWCVSRELCGNGSHVDHRQPQFWMDSPALFATCRIPISAA
jgi:hypothetical protein